MDIVVVSHARCSPERLFDLSLDMDVHAASLASSRERTSTSTGRPVLALGDEVTLRARHFGVPWRMTNRITEHDRPHRFVDEQVRGPFSRLRHEHEFEPFGNGVTRMTDRLSVAAPLGPVGVVVTRWLLRGYLERLLHQRAEHLIRLADRSAR